MTFLSQVGPIASSKRDSCNDQDNSEERESQQAMLPIEKKHGNSDGQGIKTNLKSQKKIKFKLMSVLLVHDYVARALLSWSHVVS